jgi:quercetin dioxygenase-like cupin family protein
MSLTIDHIEDLPRNTGRPDNFTGAVYHQRVAAAPDGSMSVARVTFGQGARTFWHTHSGGQVLHFLEGRGRAQVRGERAVDAVVGDVVRIPPLAEHWHGAHPDEAQQMRHMAMSFGAVTWLDAVAEEEYRAR